MTTDKQTPDLTPEQIIAAQEKAAKVAEKKAAAEAKARAKKRTDNERGTDKNDDPAMRNVLTFLSPHDPNMTDDDRAAKDRPRRATSMRHLSAASDRVPSAGDMDKGTGNATFALFALSALPTGDNAPARTPSGRQGAQVPVSKGIKTREACTPSPSRGTTCLIRSPAWTGAAKGTPRNISPSGVTLLRA